MGGYSGCTYSHRRYLRDEPEYIPGFGALKGLLLIGLLALTGADGGGFGNTLLGLQAIWLAVAYLNIVAYFLIGSTRERKVFSL